MKGTSTSANGGKANGGRCETRPHEPKEDHPRAAARTEGAKNSLSVEADGNGRRDRPSEYDIRIRSLGE